MRLQTVSPRRGIQWIREGFRVFARRPLAFAALFAAFMFAVFLLALLPFIGPLLVLALLPLVTLAFMIATRIAIGDASPTPLVFIDPLRGDRRRTVAMVQLGLGYAAATFAIMWLSDLVDGGSFESLMDALPAGQTAPETVEERLAAPGLGLGLLLRFGLAGLLSVPYWHAPALVHWGGQGCAKALFSSTVAVWRNRGAFAVYGLAWFALIVLVGMGSNLVFALLGAPQLFALAAVPMSLLFTTVFYVSLYFTFADCFAARESAPGPELT